ncbi:hypothetical protein Tco_1159541 [Tanacetum coccineum]
MKSFFMELDVNIVAWNYLVNGMLINLIKNLYVPFGIPLTLNSIIRMVFTQENCGGQDMALPPRNQRHWYLRFKGLQYTDADITDFEMRLGKIYSREIAQGQGVFTSRSWRSLFKIRGPLIHELILEFFSTFRFGEAVLDLDTARALQFQLGGVRRHFLGTTSSYTSIRDSMLRLCHRLITYSIVGRSQAPEKVTVTDLFYLRGMDVSSVNIPYLLARYLRLFALGKKQGAMISGGQFVARLICEELDDTWAWVASRPDRKQVVTTGAAKAAEDAPVVDEGASAVPTPVQAPQPPPPMVGPARTMVRRLGRLEEDVHGLRGALGQQREVLDSMARDISLIHYMDGH